MIVVHFERQFSSVGVNVVVEFRIPQRSVGESVTGRYELGELPVVTVERRIERPEEEQLVLESRDMSAEFRVSIKVGLMQVAALQIEASKIIGVLSVSLE